MDLSADNIYFAAEQPYPSRGVPPRHRCYTTRKWRGFTQLEIPNTLSSPYDKKHASPARLHTPGAKVAGSLNRRDWCPGSRLIFFLHAGMVTTTQIASIPVIFLSGAIGCLLALWLHRGYTKLIEIAESFAAGGEDLREQARTPACVEEVSNCIFPFLRSVSYSLVCFLLPAYIPPAHLPSLPRHRTHPPSC